MKQFTIVHEFACTPERFWRLFFDPEFNAALYRDGLRVEGYAVLASRETEEEIQRTITGRPQLKIPAAAQKFVGDRLSFTEEGRFDKRDGRYQQHAHGQILPVDLNTEHHHEIVNCR